MKRIEQIRARLAQISASLGEFANCEAFTDEQMKQMDDLNAEFANLTTELETLERTQENLAKAQASTGRKVAPAAPAASTPAASSRFESVGDFLMAVKQSVNGQLHPNFRNAVHFEKNGEDGGFLVPEEVSNAIIKKLAGDESLFSRTRQFTVSQGNTLSLPIDETQPWNSGIRAFWVDEGGSITSTKNKLGRAEFKLKKLAAMVELTDELLDDAPAMESYVMQECPSAIMHAINEAILTGNGVGKPSGLISSPFTVTVPKENLQAADTVVARNITNMYSRMFPAARAGAIWLIHAAVEPQLLTLKDDNGNFIYLAPGSQMNQSPYGLLLGRPVIPMMSALPTLGDSGDILFVNLNYYFTLIKRGIKQATSIHMKFDQEITAFRFTMRVDGNVPFKNPVTTQYGNYQMSAFVKLADRA